MADAAISPGRGFRDPPVDSAHAFRAILEAMAHPGRVVDFGPPIDPPGGAHLALAGVLLTLADPDTTVWLSPALDREPMRQWLRFHTGARLTHDPSAATFAAGHADELLAVMGQLAHGTAEYPDRSATLLVAVEAFDGAAPVRLSGPGNPAHVVLAARPAPEAFWRRLARNAQTFPLGLDCILCAQTSIAAVPRSNAVTPAGDV
jgi:alpha-D-ribose 1-methylphosphonate 5-triphosphate synthase subunit PhnH